MKCFLVIILFLLSTSSQAVKLTSSNILTILAETPTDKLITAISCSNLVLAQEAIQANANVNALIGRFTPLNYAQRTGNSAMVQFLLFNNANPFVKNSYGKNALEFCPQAGSWDIHEYSKSKQAIRQLIKEYVQNNRKGARAALTRILCNVQPVALIEDVSKIIALYVYPEEH